MTFATAKEKQTSTRWFQIRITPRRYVSTDLASIGSGVYQMTLANTAIAKIERVGTVLTETTSPPGANDFWSHDESTGILQIKLASAPSSTNVVIVFYYLFYTTNLLGAYAHEDPEDTTTPERFWDTRIKNPPAVTQSVRNLLDGGVFSIQSSSFSIANEDAAFQPSLTTNVSFNNCDVSIWSCIDNLENINKVFIGRVNAVQDAGPTVTFDCNDGFSRLLEPALMGDTEDQAYIIRRSGGYPSMDPSKSGRPCKYIAAPSSRYKTKDFPDNPTFFAAGVFAKFFLTDGMEEAVVTVKASKTTSTNREWVLCRLLGDAPTQSFGTITRTQDTGIGQRVIHFSAPVNLHVGDTLRWTEGTAKYGTIRHVGDFTWSFDGLAYNVIVGDVFIDHTTGSTMTASPAVSIAIDLQDGLELRYPMYGRDYTIAYTTTAAGHKLAKVTFVNNFEANLTFGGASLDPDRHKVFYRITNPSPLKHGALLKRICQLVNIDVNSASFDAADTALPVNTYFSIPQYDELDYDSYAKYAQLVAESTLGYLVVNNDLEAEYSLLEAPTPTRTLDHDNAGLGALRSSVAYDDIVTQLIAYNPHNASQAAIDSATGPSQTVSSDVAKYLHGAVRPKQFRHVLEGISTRIAAIFAAKKNPQVTYRFKTASDDIDTVIGDNLTIDSPFVSGYGGAVVVTRTVKDTDFTEIEATVVGPV